jgi:TolA-binding protein
MNYIVKPITNFMKAICLTSVVMLHSSNSQSQPFNMSQYKFNLLFENAFELMLSGEWDKALPVFINLYQTDTTNSNLCYLTGFCLYKLRREPATAVQLLEKASLAINPKYIRGISEERKAPITTFYYLGELQYLEGDFQDALASYMRYLAWLPGSQLHAKHETQLMIATVEAAIKDNSNPTKNIANR